MKLYLLYLLFVLLLLFGCSGYRDVDTIDRYRTGYRGAEISFVRNAPPREILQDSLFSIGVEVHNRGATSIERGYLSLNYDSDYIRLFSASSKTISLEGRNPFNPQGESRPFFFEGTTLLLDPESARRTVPIIASFCYPYTTTLVDTVCLDFPHITSRERGLSVCTLQDKRYQGQGAPVGVSSVDITITSGQSQGIVKPIFDIIITHSGRGIVLDPDNYVGPCVARGSTNNLNTVRIARATISDIPLVCNTDVITLRDGSARVRCELSQGVYEAMLPFEAPLSIILEYGYMSSATVQTDILKR